MWIAAGMPEALAGPLLPATALALAGVGIALAGVVAFRAAGTTVDPREPSKVSALVRSGIYARTRNPMYLGFLFVLGGWALGLANPINGLLLVMFYFWLDSVQIPAEEAAIRERFGEDYARYCQQVRRWL